MKPFIKYLLLVVLIGGIIYILSSISNPYDLIPYKLYYRLKTDELFNVRVIYYVEGLLHFCLFAFLAAAIARIFTWNGKLRVTLLILAIIMASVFGWMNEIHQLSVPQRAFEWQDILIDSLGALAGVVLFSFWHKKHHPKHIENNQKIRINTWSGRM